MAERLLPAYRPGLSAVAGMVTAAALAGISMPLRYAMLTVGRTRSMLLVTAMAVAISLVGGIFVLNGSEDRLGVRLGFVAWTSAAACGTLLLATLCLCMFHGEQCWKVIAIAFYLLVGALVLQYLRPHWGTSVVVAAAWSVLPLWRLGFMVDWRSIIKR
jgi:hypothetical protein